MYLEKEEEPEQDVKTFHLNVYGMTCSSCEGNLEKKVMAMRGAKEANFSVLTKQGKVKIDINQLSVREVIEVLNVGKFSASLKDKNTKVDIRQTIEKESKDKRRHLLFALLMWVPIYCSSSGLFQT